MSLIDSAMEKLRDEVLEIEKRTDLSERDKRSQIIHLFSVISAAVAVQPIPFADIFVLTPIQAYMGTRLSAIRGMPISEQDALDLVKQVGVVVGLGMVAQQIALGLYKTGLPFLAGFTTIPLVYGLTYAMGRVIDQMLEAKSRGEVMSEGAIRDAWAAAKKEGKTAAKKARSEVAKVKDLL